MLGDPLVPFELSFAKATNDRFVGCDCSNLEARRRTTLGRFERPVGLNFNCLCDGQSIFELDTQIADSAVHLCVAK